MKRARTIAAIVWLEMLRRKDVYVLLILLGALLAALVSLDVFGLGGAVGYVKDIGLLMAWLFGWVLAVALSTRQLPQEEARGTIFPLLAKPISRRDLLAGKWLGCWSVVATATAVFYVLVAAVAAAKGGRFDPLALAQGYLLHTAALAVIVAIGLLLSTRLNQDAASALAYIVSGAAFLLLPRVPQLAASSGGLSATLMLVLYHLLPHLELFDMRKRLVHDFGPVRWPVFAAVLAYGVLLTVLFVLLAWLAYRRKRFTRGDLAA